MTHSFNQSIKIRLQFNQSSELSNILSYVMHRTQPYPTCLSSPFTPLCCISFPLIDHPAAANRMSTNNPSKHNPQSTIHNPTQQPTSKYPMPMPMPMHISSPLLCVSHPIIPASKATILPNLPGLAPYTLHYRLTQLTAKTPLAVADGLCCAPPDPFS